MAGGLYDQHPVLLERFLYIMQEEAAWEKQKEAAKTRGKGGPAPKNAKMPLPREM